MRRWGEKRGRMGLLDYATRGHVRHRAQTNVDFVKKTTALTAIAKEKDKIKA